jgi:hypothetical protein
LPNRRIILTTSAALLAGAALLAPAEAPAGDPHFRYSGAGPRIGVSLGPHQLTGGGHVDWGDVFTQTRVFLPVVEIGLGDNQFLASFGTEMFYRFVGAMGSWTPYAGGELALILGNREIPELDDNENFSDLALLGVLGLERPVTQGGRFAFEIKIGLVDAPDVKLLAYWTFPP